MFKENSLSSEIGYQVISFNVNGTHAEVNIPQSMLLIDLIRDILKLKGKRL